MLPGLGSSLLLQIGPRCQNGICYTASLVASLGYGHAVAHRETLGSSLGAQCFHTSSSLRYAEHHGLERSAANGAPKTTSNLTSGCSLPTFTDDERRILRDTKVICFSAQNYVRKYIAGPLASVFPHTTLVETSMNALTASLAEGHEAVVIFVNDTCDAEVVRELAGCGVKLIALRCAGYDRVDVAAANAAGLRVVRVPAYSPSSVAEHAVALMFALNRNLHNAHWRVMQGNYSLSGLVGFEVKSKTAGVVGTGAIGIETCRILKGIGCNVLAYDKYPGLAAEALGVRYVPLEQLLAESDIVSLHCPLTPETHHLINRDSIARMKRGVMLINTSRGGLVDTPALLEALESGAIGAVGLDTYENEGALFFTDHTADEPSQRMRVWDRSFKALQMYPQALVTPHSAFLTQEALSNICNTTIANIAAYKLGRLLGSFEVKPHQ